MDLTATPPKLTVRTATVHGSPRVAETVQHISEQGRKTRMVQPITTKLSIGSEGDVDSDSNSDQ
jgi:hypothetical protein